jgi:hypothetical protein
MAGGIEERTQRDKERIEKRGTEDEIQGDPRNQDHFETQRQRVRVHCKKRL